MRRYCHDERGATAVEYAAIAVLVSISILAGAQAIGTSLSGLYFEPLLDGFEH